MVTNFEILISYPLSILRPCISMTLSIGLGDPNLKTLHKMSWIASIFLHSLLTDHFHLEVINNGVICKKSDAKLINFIF